MSANNTLLVRADELASKLPNTIIYHYTSGTDDKEMLKFLTYYTQYVLHPSSTMIKDITEVIHELIVVFDTEENRPNAIAVVYQQQRGAMRCSIAMSMFVRNTEWLLLLKVAEIAMEKSYSFVALMSKIELPFPKDTKHANQYGVEIANLHHAALIQFLTKPIESKESLNSLQKALDSLVKNKILTPEILSASRKEYERLMASSDELGGIKRIHKHLVRHRRV